METGEHRLLGPWMTTALVVGGMVGAGIFMLPVSLAPFGPNATISWIVSGLGAVALAFSMSRLARRADGGCGMQAHVEAALGPTLGFLAGFSFWVTVWVSNAAVGITAASALARLVPALSGEAAVLLVATAIIVVLAIINALGAVMSGRFAVATTIAKLTPLVLALAIAGAFLVGGRPLYPTAAMPVSLDSIASATAIAVFAVLGFETALAPVGKIRDPQRNIPLAMVGGTAFVAILYLLTSSALVALAGSDALAVSKAPFADALARGFGSTGVLIAVAGMAISALGYMNGGVLVTGELGLAMAQRGDLPHWFARTDAKGTPVTAQLIASGLTILLVAANAWKGSVGLFTFSVLLTTSASLWMYVLCALAAWKLNRDIATRGIVVVGLTFTAFAFYGSGWEANAWSVALLAVGIAVRWLIRRGSTPQPAG